MKERLVFGVDTVPKPKVEYKTKTRYAGVKVRCPDCGKWVRLYEETEEWDAKTGKHLSYGPAQGGCCGNVFLDDFNGFHCYRSKEK